MKTWAVDVRYPGVPLDPWPAEELDEPTAQIGSVTVCGPDHTTLHMYVTAAGTASDALQAAIRAADRVASAVGLQVEHVAAAVAM